jgi:hypothetical protein
MNAASQLLHFNQQTRRYCGSGEYIEIIKNEVSRIQSKHGGGWSENLRIIGDPDDGIFETKSLVCTGNSDLSLVERCFDVKLPDSAHLFYQNITECVLTLRLPLVVLSPEGIVVHETWHRDIYRQCGISLPVQVIRFVMIPNDPINFAFRQNTKDKRWRIMLVSSTDEHPSFYHSNECDGLEDDEDIDAWMERMLSSDGFPLRKGAELYERPAADRIG